MAPKRKPGRPSLGSRARTRVVPLKLSELEHAAIVVAVEQQGPPTTVSSWIRDHALEPLKR